MEKINYKNIYSHLNNHGVLAYPTETLWGLGGLASSVEATELVYKIKKRTKEMPLSLLVQNSKMAEKYCKVDSKTKVLLDLYWPGPVTFILPKLNNKLDYLNNGSDLIGLRCSSHSFCKEFFLDFDEAIVTTSANESSKPSAKTFSELSWLPKEVLKINDESYLEEELFLEGSTIVKYENGNLETLRPGPVEVTTIELPIKI